MSLVESGGESGSVTKFIVNELKNSPLHSSLTLGNNLITDLNYSLSGNDIYAKST